MQWQAESVKEFNSLRTLLDKHASTIGVREYAAFQVPVNRPPWLCTEFHVQPGDCISTLAVGRTYLSREADIWLGPQYQLWFRIGEGRIFRGTRDTHTFTAEESGALQLASYFPGEWATEAGQLATPPEDYQAIDGELTVVVIKWQTGIDPKRGLAPLLDAPEAAELIKSEIDRLTRPVPPPVGWKYLWFLGPAEIFRKHENPDKPGAICCHTKRDVAILQRDAECALELDTHIEWSWKVDELPSDLSEDTIPTHDYLSVAVEFDNGQDLSYMWSANLAPETTFRCPLPTWAKRETHVVLRSGNALLGQWLRESRNVAEDYARAVGGPLPAKIVRVWLIATSVFQRKEGRCEFADITLRSADRRIDVR